MGSLIFLRLVGAFKNWNQKYSDLQKMSMRYNGLLHQK